jgi:hypothetical protein
LGELGNFWLDAIGDALVLKAVMMEREIRRSVVVVASDEERD